MKKTIFVATMALFAATGCKQNEMMDPQVPDGAYFYWHSREDQQQETANMTFSLLRDTMWCDLQLVQINTTGDQRDYERKVALQQKPGDHAAIALPHDKDITDTKAWLWAQARNNHEDLSTVAKIEAATAAGITAHYVPYDHPKMMEWVMKYTKYAKEGKPADIINVFKPKVSTVKLPYLLLRDPSMSTLTSTAALVQEGQPLNIELTVKPNEYFVQGITDRNLVDRHVKHTIFFSNMLEQPSTWDGTFGGMFGTWGPVKFQYFCDATGFANWELRDGVRPTNDEMNYMIYLTQKRIDAYNLGKPDAEKLREPNTPNKVYRNELVTAKAKYTQPVVNE